MSVRIGEGLSLSLHALVALAGGLLAISQPLLGAAICLLGAFSFYSERALGSPLLGRMVPTRASQNVVSPAPGPAWEEVEIILAAGYDLPRSYPVGEWLSRRFSGTLTTDRIVFWAGMVPVLLTAMLYVATVEGLAPQIVQLVGSTVLFAMITAQFDAHLTGDPESDPEDLRATGNLLAALDELLEQATPILRWRSASSEPRPDLSAGASAFFGRRSPVSGNPAVINFVKAAGEAPECSAGPRSC